MATRVWLGGAAPLAHKVTLTVTGTATAADDVTLTINGKDLSFVVGASLTDADVAEMIETIVNGSAINNGETRTTTTGDKVGEFARITATRSTNVTTLTADDAGVEFTLTIVENSTVTITDSTVDQATGPEWWDNPDNWSGDTVPVSTDDLLFDHRAVSSLKYALAQSAVLVEDMVITSGFIHDIGLPEINEDQPDLPYDEYRGTYLQIGVKADDSTRLVIGQGEGSGSGRIKIDTGVTSKTTWIVQNAGQPAEQGIPSVLLKSTDATNVLEVFRGNVGIAFFDDETSSVLTTRIGNKGNVDTDVQVVFGTGCTLDAGSSTMVIYGGTIEASSALDILSLDGGTMTLNDDPDGVVSTIGTANLRNGTLIHNSTGTITTLELYGSGAIFDLSQGAGGVTITNCTVRDGSGLRDPLGRGTWTNGIIMEGTPSGLGELLWRRNVKWTPLNQ